MIKKIVCPRLLNNRVRCWLKHCVEICKGELADNSGIRLKVNFEFGLQHDKLWVKLKVRRDIYAWLNNLASYIFL